MAGHVGTPAGLTVAHFFQQSLPPMTRGMNQMNRVLRTSAAVVAVTLASLAFATASASAASKSRLERAGSSQSTTFAGYAVGATGGSAVTSVFAAFKVPSVTCGATESSGVLPMAEMFSSTGTAYAAGGVYVACDNGKLMLQNYLEINNYSPVMVTFTPAAGDQITVAAKQTSAGAKVTLYDVTQKKVQTFVLLGSRFAGSDDTTNIGVSTIAISGVDVPNAGFGTIAFSRAMTNGVAIGTLPNTAYDEATASTGGAVKVVSSRLSKAGNWFRTTQMHAA
jgi:hypothetical protein